MAHNTSLSGESNERSCIIDKNDAARFSTLYKVENSLLFDNDLDTEIMLNLIIISSIKLAYKFTLASQYSVLYYLSLDIMNKRRKTINAIAESSHKIFKASILDELIKFNCSSSSFDAETCLANQEKRQEISQLSQLARDCYDELQYAKAEKFYQRAANLAEQINDLSLMIHNRFWLATAQRMQNKYQEALGTFTWLIEVAYNPELNRELNDNNLWHVADGFVNFMEVGRNLPNMLVADLEKVLERGLDWLSTIGKNNWSAGLRLMKGKLWQNQELYEKALTEMKTALALQRRNPNAPGYTLGAHILNMGDLLQKMQEFPGAADCYQEVVDGYEFSDYVKQWAWKGLAQISISLSDYSTAEQQALKSLELARGIESPAPMMFAYDVLGDVYWKQERIELAITAKIQAWQYARQFQPAKGLHDLYSDFAEIRLYQARHSRPHHYIPKAQQWLHRALPLAIRLDHQVNSTTKQTKIRDLQAQCAKLLAESQAPLLE